MSLLYCSHGRKDLENKRDGSQKISPVKRGPLLQSTKGYCLLLDYRDGLHRVTGDEEEQCGRNRGSGFDHTEVLNIGLRSLQTETYTRRTILQEPCQIEPTVYHHGQTPMAKKQRRGEEGFEVDSESGLVVHVNFCKKGQHRGPQQNPTQIPMS